MPLLISLALLLSACSSSTGPDNTTQKSLCSDIPGTICTWAGTGDAGFNGDGHTLLASTLYWPVDLAFTHSNTPYILDWNNHRVRRVTADNTLTTAIGTDFIGHGPYDESDQSLPGAPGGEVHLNHPTHILPLNDGTLLLTSWHNHKLRLYNPRTDRVHIIAGSGPGFAGDGGPARDALFSQPPQTALAPDGSLYVLDQRNQRVRKIDANGVITTVVGTGEPGFSGDDGPPNEAQLQLPAGANPLPAGGLAFDPQGRLYISDALNNRIRRFLAHEFNGVLIAQPVRPFYRVKHVPAPVVLTHVAERRTDTTLRGDRVGSRRKHLGDASRAQTRFGKSQTRSKPCATCSYYDYIVLMIYDWICCRHASLLCDE